MFKCPFHSTLSSSNFQSYGQYSKLFYDVKEDTDKDSSLVGDSDDEDKGK